MSNNISIERALQLIVQQSEQYYRNPVIFVRVIEVDESESLCTCIPAENYNPSYIVNDYDINNIPIYYKVKFGAGLVPRKNTEAYIIKTDFFDYILILAKHSSGQKLEQSDQVLDETANAKFKDIKNNYLTIGKGIWHLSEYGLFAVNWPFYSFTTKDMKAEFELLFNMANLSVNENGGIFIGQTHTDVVKVYKKGNEKISNLLETYDMDKSDSDNLIHMQDAIRFLITYIPAKDMGLKFDDFKDKRDTFARNNPNSAHYVNFNIYGTSFSEGEFNRAKDDGSKTSIYVAASLNNLFRAEKLGKFERTKLDNKDYENFRQLKASLKTYNVPYVSSSDFNKKVYDDFLTVCTFITNLGFMSYRFNVSLLNDLFTAWIATSSKTVNRLHSALNKYVSSGIKLANKGKDDYTTTIVDLPSEFVINKQTKHSLNETLTSMNKINNDNFEIMNEFLEKMEQIVGGDLAAINSAIGLIKSSATIAKVKLKTNMNKYEDVKKGIDEYLLKDPIKYEGLDTVQTRPSV